MKILCVFYGIGRGLQVSVPSIKENILNRLAIEGHDLNIVYVLNEKHLVNNPRSGDFGELSKIEDGVFEETILIRTTEDELVDNDLFELTRMYRDMHDDNYKSNYNLICQLAMLKKATQFVDYDNFDRVILCRDDIVFKNEWFDWYKPLAVSRKGPVVSVWHWHNGISERFVLADACSAKKISSRIDLLCDYFNEYDSFNAELLQRFCFKYHGLVPYAINLKLARIRLNGLRKNENYRIAFWRPNEAIRSLTAWVNYSMVTISYKTEDLF